MKVEDRHMLAAALFMVLNAQFMSSWCWPRSGGNPVQEIRQTTRMAALCEGELLLS